MKIIPLLVFTLALASCATPTVMLVHPVSGDIRPCQAIGMGLIPAITAVKAVDACVEQYKALGYKRADELTPEERARLSPKPYPTEIEIKQK